MSGGQYRVESYAAEPTPHNAINEKAIVDAEAVGEAIRRAVKRSGAKSRLAAIAISGDAAITKVIQMPKNLGENELEGQVEMQADQYIPFPMEEVSYDYQVVGPSEKDPDMLDVLAGRDTHRERRAAPGGRAGLRPDRAHRRRRSFRARERLRADASPDARWWSGSHGGRGRFRREQHHVQRVCAT